MEENGSKRFLTADEIRAMDDLPLESMWVPEWSGNVWLRGMTAVERDTYEASLMNKRTGEQDLKNARAKMLQKALCNEDGSRLFEPAEVAMLGKRAAKPVDRIWSRIRELSGMTAAAREEIAEDFAKTQDESETTE